MRIVEHFMSPRGRSYGCARSTIAPRYERPGWGREPWRQDAVPRRLALGASSSRQPWLAPACHREQPTPGDRGCRDRPGRTVPGGSPQTPPRCSSRASVSAALAGTLVRLRNRQCGVCRCGLRRQSGVARARFLGVARTGLLHLGQVLHRPPANCHQRPRERLSEGRQRVDDVWRDHSDDGPVD